MTCDLAHSTSRTFPHTLLLLALPLISVCGLLPPELRITGTEVDIGVGSSVSYKLMFAQSKLCGGPPNASGITAPDSCTESTPAQIQEASLSAPGIFEIVSTTGGKVQLKAMAPGQVTLTVRAASSSDEDTVEQTVSAWVADGIQFSTTCDGGDSLKAGPFILPAGTSKYFSLKTLSGTTVLYVDQEPEIHCGGQILSEGGNTIDYKLPDEPGETAFTSPDFPGFKEVVRGYQAPQVSGVLLQRADQSQDPVTSHHVEVQARLLVGGVVPCKELPESMTRSIKVETPSICTLKAGEQVAELQVPDYKAFKVYRRSYVRKGLCQISATLEGTQLSHTLDIELKDNTKY